MEGSEEEVLESLEVARGTREEAGRGEVRTGPRRFAHVRDVRALTLEHADAHADGFTLDTLLEQHGDANAAI